MVEFKEPTPWVIKYVADNMRRADVVEVMASGDYSPSEALEMSMELSEFSSVAFINDQPCAIFGLTQGDILTGTGVPWMLGTENVVKYRRQFLNNSKQVIDDMITLCPKLVNHVHADNEVSIHWLRWLGFTIDEPAPYGVNDELFHRFHMGIE